MAKDKELTTEEKWAEVDAMLDIINERKAKGERECYTYLEEYVNYHFNGEKNVG